MVTALQKNIKLQLEKRNLSVAELERRAGLRHAVINIMHGRSKNPSIKVARAIAKELGCSIEELISESSINVASAAQCSTSEALLACSIDNNIRWDYEIAKDVFNLVQDGLLTKKPDANINDFIKCFLESYNYCYGSADKQADKRFIFWFIDRYTQNT